MLRLRQFDKNYRLLQGSAHNSKFIFFRLEINHSSSKPLATLGSKRTHGEVQKSLLMLLFSKELSSGENLQFFSQRTYTFLMMVIRSRMEDQNDLKIHTNISVTTKETFCCTIDQVKVARSLLFAVQNVDIRKGLQIRAIHIYLPQLPNRVSPSKMFECRGNVQEQNTKFLQLSQD